MNGRHIYKYLLFTAANPSNAAAKGSLLLSLKRLLQVSNNIIDVLSTDGKADRVRINSLLHEFLLIQFRMRRTGRMDHQGLHICNICKKTEQLQSVDEILRLLRSALNAECEYGARSVREVFLVESLLLRVLGKRRMADALDLRNRLQIINDL